MTIPVLLGLGATYILALSLLFSKANARCSKLMFRIYEDKELHDQEKLRLLSMLDTIQNISWIVILFRNLAFPFRFILGESKKKMVSDLKNPRFNEIVLDFGGVMLRRNPLTALIVLAYHMAWMVVLVPFFMFFRLKKPQPMSKQISLFEASLISTLAKH